MTRSKFRLAAAALSALAVAGMGMSPAFAAPVPDPAVTAGPAAANPALINKDARTTLTLTKYAGDPTGQPNDGTPITVTPGTPLAGVTFKITKVAGVDLTTNQGWQDASDYYNALATNGVPPLDTTVTATGVTDAAGNITFNDLPIGLYYVQETEAPAGYTATTKDFLVTLPMTNPTNETEWMYNVHVYPKNQYSNNDTITKTVEDKGTVTTEGGVEYGAAGDHKIDYTLKSDIADAAGPLGMYVIYDDLDPSLTFTGASLALSNGTELVVNTDYKVYTAPDGKTAATPYTAGTTVAGGPLVTIVFTDAGLTKLEANRTAQVVTTLNTTVGAKDADGIVPNKSSFIPNQGWWNQHGTPGVNPETPDLTPPGTDTPPGTPSNEVVSKYGDLIIDKYDPVGGAKLAGAQFSIYRDAVGGDICAPAEMVDANLIAPAGTTDGTGALTFKGLQASDFYNNATQTDLITYCLVETKAPDGYNLDATPRSFTINNGQATALQVVPATTVGVANEKSNLANSLPLTGGAGVAALSLGGLALVGGGLAYYAVSSRKRREQDA